MAEDIDTTSAEGAQIIRPRKWRNRRPPAKRAELRPQEVEQRQKQRQSARRKSALHVQLTEAEKATLKQRASGYGMKLSEFVRTVALSELKEPPPPRTYPDAIRALAFQLSKIGTNLNQLAHVANETHRILFEKKLLDLADQIATSLERVIAL
jgi:hypothetical protein